MPEVGAQVAALHVHHGMRGAEADADERAVQTLCAELGVECFLSRRDVPAEAAAGGVGVELAGRRARYEEYERIACEQGFDHLATAHTGTDRAETLLLNLLRGAGLRGMAESRPGGDELCGHLSTPPGLRPVNTAAGTACPSASTPLTLTPNMHGATPCG